MPQLDPNGTPADSPAALPRIALVTGAGTGIGRAAALGLLRAGWRLVLVGRREEALRDTQAAAPDPSLCLVRACNVADASAVKALFAEVEQRFGRLDLLFNNAGLSAPALPVDELSVEQWQSVVDVNLTGSFLCAQAAFGLMKRQQPRGGRIINNGSIAAHVPRPNSAPYTATKHAITGLTKALSLDGRDFDIAVGQIDIGNAATEMARPMQQGVRQANGSIAVEATMDVQLVADTLVHLAQMPLSVNVPFMTLMANRMPYIGRG
ncbi:SDR family oxidoreductase [Mitsuaria sp. WAJ17]|uniref:SDR family oxidoreductase n=1 Tax=Mitsuaria sp. WAJ17 TaxID=2761452 RepID=UPI0016038D3F|nr:SDR family oxidoreductase [Mitsuaria sp. WAJ17]MBB2486850.1 SDR family oxidoreductase [Mitsuaria sp. WAJ17]